MESSEIESLRRSMAMLPPQAAGLNREEAMRLLSDLQEMDQRLGDVRESLTASLCNGSQRLIGRRTWPQADFSYSG
jgi:hypothetical protein